MTRSKVPGAILRKRVLRFRETAMLMVGFWPGDEHKILELEQQWMDAMKGRDETMLNRFVAPEFSLAGIGELERPPVSRATWIDNTLHHLKVDSFSFDKATTQLLGETAIVQAVFTWKGSFDNERFTDTGLLIDVWLKRGDSWQVVSRFVGDYKKPAK